MSQLDSNFKFNTFRKWNKFLIDAKYGCDLLIRDQDEFEAIEELVSTCMWEIHKNPPLINEEILEAGYHNMLFKGIWAVWYGE